MKHLLFYVLMLASSAGFGQVSISWSQYQPSTDDGGKIQGAYQGKLYSVVLENKTPYLSTYSDDDLQHESFVELVLGKKARIGNEPKSFSFEQMKKRYEEKNKDFRYEKSFIVKNKVIVIYYTQEKKIKTFYSQVFDLEGRPVVAMGQMESYESRSWSVSHYFGLSEDSTMLYMFRQPKLKGDEKDKFFIKTWDLDMAELANIEMEVPYTNKEFSIYDYYLTSAQKLVTLCRIDVPKKERGPEDASCYFKLMTVDVPTKTLTEYEMNLSQLYIRDVNLRFDEQENAYCVGIYSDTKDRSGMDGTFYYKLNYSTGEISSEYKEAFSKELIYTMNNSESKRKRNQDLRANIDLVSVLPKSDGGSYVLFEENYVVVYTTRNSNGSYSSTYYYHNNDILIMNLAPDGKILWQAVIPKQQVSVNDNGFFNSFYSTVFNDKLYIVFNDHVKNVDSGKFDQEILPAQGFKYTTPVTIAVKEDGDYEKIAILPNRQERDYRVQFKSSLRRSPNQCILYGYRSPKGCFSGYKKGSDDYLIGRLIIE